MTEWQPSIRPRRTATSNTSRVPLHVKLARLKPLRGETPLFGEHVAIDIGQLADLPDARRQLTLQQLEHVAPCQCGDDRIHGEVVIPSGVVGPVQLNGQPAPALDHRF